MTVDAIKESSQSTGTGNIVLSAVNGFRRFSDEFSAGQQVCYRIEGRNGSNYDGQYEIGIGELTVGGQLQRNSVDHSSSGNGVVHNFTSPNLFVYYADSEEAISRVRCEYVGASAPAIHGIPSNDYAPNGLLTTVAYLGQDVHLLFFQCPRDLTITSVAAEVISAGATAGHVMRTGLYNCDRFGVNDFGGFRVKDILVDFGAIDVTTTGNKEWITNQPLKRGKSYAIAWWSSVAENIGFRVCTYNETGSRHLQSTAFVTSKHRRHDGYFVDGHPSGLPASLDGATINFNSAGSTSAISCCPIGLGWT